MKSQSLRTTWKTRAVASFLLAVPALGLGLVPIREPVPQSAVSSVAIRPEMGVRDRAEDATVPPEPQGLIRGTQGQLEEDIQDPRETSIDMEAREALALTGSLFEMLPEERTGHRDPPAEGASEEQDPEELYHSIIVEASRRYGVDPALVKAVIRAESGYDPRAVSKKGAAGLMQLMPQTAASLGVEDAFDPEHNIHAGVRYLRTLLDAFDGDLALTLAAYNAGTSRVRKYNKVPPIESTRRYVKKVLSYYRIYKERRASDSDRA